MLPERPTRRPRRSPRGSRPRGASCAPSVPAPRGAPLRAASRSSSCHYVIRAGTFTAAGAVLETSRRLPSGQPVLPSRALGNLARQRGGGRHARLGLREALARTLDGHDTRQGAISLTLPSLSRRGHSAPDGRETSASALSPKASSGIGSLRHPPSPSRRGHSAPAGPGGTSASALSPKASSRIGSKPSMRATAGPRGSSPGANP